MEYLDIPLPALTEAGAPTRRAYDDRALLMSAPCDGDVDELTQICQDPEIQEWTTVPVPYTRDHARSFVAAISSEWESGCVLTWFVRDPQQPGRVLGCVSLRTEHDAVWSIGYWTAPDYRGLGIMERSLRAVLTLACDADGPIGARTVRWSCEIHEGVPNWASWRVAWAVGFTREGLIRDALVNKGTVHDAWTGSLRAGEALQPRAPWDGPTPQEASHDSLVPHDGVGEREGDDPEALVRRFHHVYGLPITTDGPSVARDRVHMRMGLIGEEFAELVGAVYGAQARSIVEEAYAQAVASDDSTRDTVEAADALADLIYVIYGMALECDIDLAAVLAEVQRSNMSKLGEDGRPIYREDGKVLKGPGFFPPDVAGVLARARQSARR